MEWIVSIAICYGTCLVLEMIFLGIAAGRESGRPFWLLVLLYSASLAWLGGDAWLQISVMDQAGRESLGVGHMILRQLMALPFLAAAVFFYVSKPGRTPRQKRVRTDFIRTLIFSAALGLLIPWILWFADDLKGGPRFLWQYALWGPIAGTLPAAVIAFMLTVNRLMNVRRVIIRVSMYFGMCFLSAAVIYAVLFWYLRASSTIVLSPLFLYMGFAVIGSMTFLLAVMHYRYLKATIQYVFFRDVYRMEKELHRFLDEFQALDSSREGQESLLEIILQNLYRVLPFDKGFIVSTDRERKQRIRYIGPPSAGLKFEHVERYMPFLRRKLPENFTDEMDRVFLLEDGFPLPFEGGMEDLAVSVGDSPRARQQARFMAGSMPIKQRDHRRVAALIRDSLLHFRDEGYRLFLPLIFRNEIWGMIFLSGKSDGTPYWNGERKLLESARLSFAMSLRNNAMIEEIKERPASWERLAAARAPATGEAQAHRIKLPADKTLIYVDEGLHGLVAKTRQIAASFLPVLIQGETGTGKELIARLLHMEGPGARAPFVPVNCAAIPASLWESEIFGHRKGAFTGAVGDHEGLVEQARGGVLFFDEIGEMPLEIQPKILRLIQEKKFQAVGGRKLQDAACRLVFATHRDLAAMSREGSFREDLYYRINVHKLVLPPLRERRADIPHIISHLSESYGKEPGFNAKETTPDALAALVRYDWPGNIRELENVVVRCLTESPGDVIDLGDLPAEVRQVQPVTGSKRGVGSLEKALIPANASDIGFEQLLKDYARQLIAHTLKACDGNRTHAARMLNISRGKLIYQIKELGLEDG